jgi:DNA-binding response OmpR family regulator
MSRILIVEDEQHIANGLRFNLEAEGHEATVASDGERALAMLLKERRPFDVIILDVMLPGKDGFTVASELRGAGHYEPILMLTARGSAEDVLRGSRRAPTITCPSRSSCRSCWRASTAAARLRWNERDPASSDGAVAAPDAVPGDVYTFAGRTLDFAAMEVRVTRRLRLTVMECDLLRYLVKNAGQPVSRRAILQEVWGLHEGVDTRAIDNFIVRLRRYIEDRPATPKFLQTVRGVGYRFVPQP